MEPRVRTEDGTKGQDRRTEPRERAAGCDERLREGKGVK